ncbi:ABC transporter ATP-binding protein [Nocardioides daeguensis]|uniref:ABC transporter ATP-binding protein n=1 Tax=Nocardioides daeguensis TaxID=908359 RepID=A0ABP6VG94_9ACTN|nr:ABC transporter ATP-binding protein [Nocardioides daeguensis]MBV6729477.1 ABC transporter ATP-binding protein [Nocardioides daeguensis]MCR1771750.1 ABC transporter ATP-binding protein [Nocardioides daeguensis]
MTEPALVLEEVSLVHGDGDESITALDHVDLAVAPGEVVAIVGPSGAGKSSLLAVAGALIAPTSGAVTLGGTALAGLNRARLTELRRTRIGFVFQTSNLIPALTAIDQLRLPLTFGKAEAPRDPQELLEAVGMAHKAKRRPDQLSGGERQRIGIARALVTRPSVLLVDEPTAALDRQRSQDVVALLARETRAHGVATIMVTHDHDVLHHCDRVHEMIDGKLGVPAPR